MIRQATAILFIFFASSYQDDWTISIKPDASHIRANTSTTIICSATQGIEQCHIQVDGRPTLDFSRGPESRAHLVTNNGVRLYGARYAGTGLNNGQCGVRLRNMAAGVYVVGCQLQNILGSLRTDYMILTVDDRRPMKVKVNRKYQVAEPGSDVAILCSTESSQPLDYCAVHLPSKQWVKFPKGHLSEDTDHYHYHGRGLEKGHCGVTLVDITEADSGLVLCKLKAGGKRAIRAGVIKVANLKPETEITWAEKTHVAPGDVLNAECVMRGAYPLPPMVWTFESNVIQISDVDETVAEEGTFKWPWEDHVIKQKVSVPIGTRLGNRTLQCDAADVVAVHDLHQTVKYIIRDSNEIVVQVHPTCGMRTNYTYNTELPRDPTSNPDVEKDIWSLSTQLPNEGVVHGSETHSPVEVLDAGNPTHSSPPSTPSLGDDVDYVEPVWDETVSGQPGDQSHRDSASNVSKGQGQVLGGGKALNLRVGKNKPFIGGIGSVFLSVGGIEVVKIPDRVKQLLAQLADGNKLIDGGGLSAGGTEVINKDKPDVHFETYPWTAGIYKKLMGKYSQQCGGTLVTETHVICAAHCFWNERESKPHPPDDYQVSLGKVFREWDLVDAYVQNRGVHQLYLHPVFRGRKRNYQHDISVIELDHAVVYTPRVAPACLDWDNEFEDRQLVEGSIGVVTGWGYTEDEKPSEVLRYVELPYVDANTCYDKLPETMQLLLTTDKFCAGFSNRNVSACPGDSGGGLMFQEPEFGAYFLRGVVSVSFRPPEFQGKCYYSEVTGFTLVSQSMSWLKGILDGQVAIA